MLKTYILLYNQQVGTRDEVKSILDSMGEVKEWRTELPYSFFILSEDSASSLVKILRERTGSKGRLIIAEIPSGNRQGWLSPATWQFLKPKQ